MKKTSSYNWLSSNGFLLSHQRVAITGSSGSLGRELAFLFAQTDNDLLLIGRNEKSLSVLKEEILSKYPNIQVDLLVMDMQKKDSLLKGLSVLEKEKIDIFFNNAGLFHQPVVIDEKYDQTFLVDFLSVALISKTLTDLNPNMIVVNTGSISYHYHKVCFEDIQGLSIKSKTRRYGMIKRLMMAYTLSLQEEGRKVFLAHPGISYTNLFNKKNHAYPVFFYYLVAPLMKILFMSPKKASLSLYYAAYLSNKIPFSYWIGPRGLFHSWGYPSKQKLSKKVFTPSFVKKVKQETEKMLKEFRE